MQTHATHVPPVGVVPMLFTENTNTKNKLYRLDLRVDYTAVSDPPLLFGALKGGHRNTTLT